MCLAAGEGAAKAPPEQAPVSGRAMRRSATAGSSLHIKPPGEVGRAATQRRLSFVPPQQSADPAQRRGSCADPVSSAQAPPVMGLGVSTRDVDAMRAACQNASAQQKDDLANVMKRVDEIMEHLNADHSATTPGGYGGHDHEALLDVLKYNVEEIFGAQEELSAERRDALEKALASINQTETSFRQTHLVQQTSTLHRSEEEEAEDDGGQSLVVEAIERREQSVLRLHELHENELDMTARLQGELNKMVEECRSKDRLVRDARRDVVEAKRLHEDAVALAGRQKDMLETANQKIMALKTELAKPPPKPPPELDQLVSDLKRARASLGLAERDIFRKEEEIAELNEKLQAMDDIESERSRLLAENERLTGELSSLDEMKSTLETLRKDWDEALREAGQKLAESEGREEALKRQADEYAQEQAAKLATAKEEARQARLELDNANEEMQQTRRDAARREEDLRLEVATAQKLQLEAVARTEEVLGQVADGEAEELREQASQSAAASTDAAAQMLQSSNSRITELNTALMAKSLALRSAETKIAELRSTIDRVCSAKAREAVGMLQAVVRGVQKKQKVLAALRDFRRFKPRASARSAANVDPMLLAEEAATVASLVDELRSLDETSAHLTHKLRVNSGLSQVLKDEALALRDRLDVLESGERQGNRAYDELRTQSRNLEESLRHKDERITALLVDKDRLRKEAATLQEELDTTRHELDDFTQENELLLQRLAAGSGTKTAMDVALSREVEHKREQAATITHLQKSVERCARAEREHAIEKRLLVHELAHVDWILSAQPNVEHEVAKALEIDRSRMLAWVEEQKRCVLEASGEEMRKSAEALRAAMEKHDHEVETKAVTCVAELKLELEQERLNASSNRSLTEQLESERAECSSALAPLEAQLAQLHESFAEAQRKGAQQQERVEFLELQAVQQAEALEQNMHTTRSVIAEVQATSKELVRDAVARANMRTLDAEAQIRENAAAANQRLKDVQDDAEKRISHMRRELNKLVLRLKTAKPHAPPHLDAAVLSKLPADVTIPTIPVPEAKPEEAVSVLPPEYELLRAEVMRAQSVMLGMLRPESAARVRSVVEGLDASLSKAPSPVEQLCRDAYHLAEIIEAVSTVPEAQRNASITWSPKEGAGRRRSLPTKLDGRVALPGRALPSRSLGHSASLPQIPSAQPGSSKYSNSALAQNTRKAWLSHADAPADDESPLLDGVTTVTPLLRFEPVGGTTAALVTATHARSGRTKHRL